MPERTSLHLDDNPLWYQDAIIYELHVRAFFDGDNDGIGDFRGLIEKLDYLQDLGVTAIWVLPFYPSPLKDDGYDIADYTDVHSSYGTRKDFQDFMQAAHRRGLRVITELVLNHTSDQHPWFRRARRSPRGSNLRDYYVWSDTPDRYQEARIIFKDFESSNWAWDPVGQAYYWHRFYSHQPDLNYDNPDVQREMLQILDFWLKMGVDGLRLDAVPYLFEREGTNCENLSETHAFLKKLRRHVDHTFKNRMLLAEANQWPEDAVAYFGEGDQCHMAFHFPVMPRLFMAIQMEDRFPVIEIMQQTPPIPEICRWAFFLRNHDELTLEMVTDEERDYMYRVYAHDPQARVNLGIRRRLAPLLGNNRRRIELMNGLLFSLPGTPIIYYGDEIGMGDNIYLGDRNSVRTPMQWSPDRNAGFSRANPQQLFLPYVIDPEYHFEAVNVEVQQNNPSSLLWWMKRLISLRKRYKAFGQGKLEFMHPDNRKVLVFLRAHEEEPILVAANLSRFVQYVELDLSEYKGFTPLEVFGQTRFPTIGELPYFLTLGPHSFYWFALERQPSEEVRLATEAAIPTLKVGESWKELMTVAAGDGLSRIIPRFMMSRPWFMRKAQTIHSTSIGDVIPMFKDAQFVLSRLTYTEGEPETYAFPLLYVGGDRVDDVLRERTHAVATKIQSRADEGVLYDATWDKDFCLFLLDAIRRRERFVGTHGEIMMSPTRQFDEILTACGDTLTADILGETRSTFINYNNCLVLKLFRRVGEGVNPDYEIGCFLTEHTAFEHFPAVIGCIEYRQARTEPATIGILQGFVPNEGDAWEYTQGVLSAFFERVLTRPLAEDEPSELSPEPKDLFALARGEPPDLAADLIGPYLDMIQLLGRRTAELHIALASEAEDPRFAPEPFSSLYQRSLYQSLRNRSRPVFERLRARATGLQEETHAIAQQVLNREEEVLKRFRSVLTSKIDASRIRCHGDYHLGHVLYTGKDFVIIDFEGDAGRPLSEVRIKHSPLRDIASMLQSLYYASHAALLGEDEGGIVRVEDRARLEPWARYWCECVSAAFLRAYLDKAEKVSFLPKAQSELERLLAVYLLEKAIHELGHELSRRPLWVRIALSGVIHRLNNQFVQG